MTEFEKLEEHPMEHYAREHQGDLPLGRLAEEFLVQIGNDNDNPRVKQAIGAALHDVQALMMTFFTLLEEMADDPDSGVVLIDPPPMKYDA